MYISFDYSNTIPYVSFADFDMIFMSLCSFPFCSHLRILFPDQ
jgi:hypothetical protein